MSSTVCWQCGDEATREFGGHSVCDVCSAYMLLEVAESYRREVLEKKLQIVKLQQIAIDENVPF